MCYFSFGLLCFSPQIAVPLLLHKICSQEWEALQALTVGSRCHQAHFCPKLTQPLMQIMCYVQVLEACMKNCGKRFHREVGRYRYLNELVKLVSPMYVGASTPEKVKKRIIEMLCSWRVAFPNETKINDAYTALKKQGLVTHEPELPVDKTLIPSPPTRPKHPVFDNEDMGKLLAELLRSKNPEDLQEANRLIKNMVKEDEVRVQKVTKRMHTLEEVSINVKLLTEMLSHYDKDNSTAVSLNTPCFFSPQELYERCDKQRRAAFKMATEAEDHDTSLGDILQASDDLSRVINSYKKIVEGQVNNGESDEPQTAAPSSEMCWNQFSSLKSISFVILPNLKALFLMHLNQSDLRISLMCILFRLSSQMTAAGSIFGITAAPSPAFMPVHSARPAPSLFHSSMPSSPALSRSQNQTVAPGSPVFCSLSPCHPPLQGSSDRGADISLSNVHVPLEAIKPSKVLPVTAYDKDGVRVLINFASDSPPGRPDVLVMVVSMLNTAPMPVHNVVLQAAVPKSMKVKLQPPSGAELAPFNPILPPASITQIMLLANPAKEKVRLRYKLSFTLGERLYYEVGEVNQFPPPETWGHL
uniref:Golgi associated, gamma adaptin ear containing, ARF binding protein 3b n=1 Tax=Oryzias sinensis TaxID=183150 RepID=A0A8C7YJ28_9TELE